MLIKKYKVKSYTVQEFLNREDVSYLDKVIDHIKRNKKKYMLLVTIIALTIDLSKFSSIAFLMWKKVLWRKVNDWKK